MEQKDFSFVKGVLNSLVFKRLGCYNEGTIFNYWTFEYSWIEPISGQEIGYLKELYEGNRFVGADMQIHLSQDDPIVKFQIKSERLTKNVKKLGKRN